MLASLKDLAVLFKDTLRYNEFIMINHFISTNATCFNLDTIATFKPYFDCDLLECLDDEKNLWFNNLLVLAQQDTGIAHCLHHNNLARMMVNQEFKNELPGFYSKEYSDQVGCIAWLRKLDTMKLENGVLSGTKHWITLLDEASFGVFNVLVSPDTQAFVLIDFNSVTHHKEINTIPMLGVESAAPGSLTLNSVAIPKEYILDSYSIGTSSTKLFYINNISDYSVITVYLGLIVGLYKEFKNYLEKQNKQDDIEFKRIGLNISGLKMMWQDNLASANVRNTSDEFWNRRNTQRTMSKSLLTDLIATMLRLGDGSLALANSKLNQKFRDAITYSVNRGSINANIDNLQFVQ